MTPIDLTEIDFKKLADAVFIASKAGKMSESVFKQAASSIGKITIEHLNLDTLASFGFSITDPIGQIAEFISNIIQSAFSGVTSFISSVISSVTSGIQDIISFVKSIPDRFWDALNYVSSLISNALSSAVSTLTNMFNDVKNAVTSLGSTVLNGVRGFFDTVYNGITTLGNTLLDSFKGFINEVKNGITTLANDAVNTFRNIGSELKNSLTTVYSDIVNLGTKFREFLVTLGDTVSNGLNLIYQEVTELPRIITQIPEVVSNAFHSAEDKVKSLYEWMRDRLTTIESKITYVGSLVLGIVGFFQGFGEGLADDPPDPPANAQSSNQSNQSNTQQQQSGLYVYGKTTADIIKGVLKGVGSAAEFLERVEEGLVSFIKDPLYYLQTYVVLPIWNGILSLGSALANGISTLGRVILHGLEEVGEGIVSLFQSFGSWVYNIISKVFSWITGQLIGLYESAKSIGSTITQLITKEILGIQKNMFQATNAMILPYTEEFIDSMGFSSPPFLNAKDFAVSWGLSHAALTLFGAFSLLTTAEMRSGSYVIRGIGQAISKSPHEIEISLKPVGLGGSIRLDFSKVIGSALSEFGEEIGKFGDEFVKALWTGYGIWFGRYLSVWWNYYFRNYIPIEFPSFNEVNTAWLRARVAENIPKDLGSNINDVMEGMLYYLKVKGYSDFIIRFWYADPKEFYTTVVDRFQIRRLVPLSGAWKLPSVSDVAQMWVRDVLRPPDIAAKDLITNLTKIYEAAGLYRDIGLLYTLLAFKYPSPERLGEFYWRGISKLLWLSDSFEEPEWRVLFNVPESWKSLSPYEIALRPDRSDILNKLISLYMRWHDYFPVAWYPNFPTDKAIQVELMADLPERVDLRWLTRWGIFQHLSDANVDVMADLQTIYNSFASLTGEETRSKAVTPNIELDARFLSRFLIARRVNPLVAPLVSVAQVHAVLTNELTLLRTGFIDSLRRGFITLDTSEQLMSGLIKINFHTGYIDPSTGAFKEIIYPKPVFWLPAERRLLQMRAIFDRYNTLLRDLINRVTYGVYWVAISEDEGIDIIKEFHPALSKHISEKIKAISGIDWLPQLDEDYINIWMQYAAQTKKIGIRTWIRRYISRIAGWVFYRVIYGWMTPDSLEELIESFSKINVGNKEIQILSDEEIAFFTNMANALYKSVKKELIPTPSNLATLSEYLDIDEATVKAAISTYNIPSPFDSLYMQYIKVRPIKSDFKALLNKARSAFVKGILTKDEWNSYLKRALSYGFTQREIDLISELADLDNTIAYAQSWLPTPSTIASLSEYVSVPSSLIEQALQKKGIPDEWKPIWRSYISIRPIADDARVLLSSYYRALRTAMFYGADLPKDLASQALAYLRAAGLTDQELAIRDLAAQLDVFYDGIRRGEVLPSLAQLATMYEYIEIPSDYIVQVLNSRRIEQTYKELWMKYLAARSISSETNRVVTAFTTLYTRYAVPQDLINTVRSLMAIGGWTQKEISIFDLELYLRRYYRTLTLLIPTIRGFITDGQYLPQYENALEDLFNTYALSLSDYAKQVQYYKTLLKNRRIWRHFAWYRSQLTYAYQYGAMTEADIRNALQKFVNLGLIDKDELEIIVEGIKIRANGYAAYRAMRYGG